MSQPEEVKSVANRQHQVDTRLIGMCVGAMIACVAIAVTTVLLPPQQAVPAESEYGYVYSGTKSSSVDFVQAAMDEESLLAFGSSEFSTPAALVPQVPAAAFGENDFGVHLMLVGEAYDQCLWQSIALGAYALEGVPRNKVVLSVSPSWFVDGGVDSETFKTRFSYSLYEGFCENERIPEDVKQYVAARLRSYGIDENDVSAAAPSLPQDYLNHLVYDFVDDLKLRQGLMEVRDSGKTKARAAVADSPDFAGMREKALEDARAHSTNNDFGLEDAFYAEQLAPAWDAVEGMRKDETYSKTPEYDDLRCFLDIADACGIEVLVVVSPLFGPYYDHIGIDAQTRERCYARIRDICEEYGAQVADYTDREYEKYFLFDIVHYGWTGWVDVEQSIYEFAVGG